MIDKARATAVLIAVTGAVLYALLAMDLHALGEPEAFGAGFHDIYDRYYLAILDGHLDLPMRVLRNEGHFLPDGTGYIYHGIAPLVTRFLFGWAVPLDEVSLAGPSIWLWSVIGTALYHLTFHQVGVWSGTSQRSVLWAGGLAATTWIASPGLLLVACISFFHEPIAIGYAATAGIVFLMTRCLLFDFPVARALLPLALLAGLVVHARPNVAVGLYIGVCLLGLVAIFRLRAKAVLPVLASLVVLGACGLSFLDLNRMKFGEALEVHGSFEAGGVQYGRIFWGREGAHSERARAFTEHGRFNVRRILPNLALYTLDPPFPRRLLVPVLALYRDATRSLGVIRVEGPRIGVAYLWGCWFLVALVGLFYRRASVSRVWPLLVATGSIALIIASYGTVTLRYRVELWPFLATLVLLGLPGFQGWLGSGRRRSLKVSVAVAAVCISILLSHYTGWMYRVKFFQDSEWSPEYCRELVLEKGFPEDRVEHLCVD